jgi:hypothetical protein
MPEPTTTTGAAGAALIAIGVSLVGSKYGPLATVAAAALIGSYIGLGEVETPGGRLGGALYLFKYTLLASLTAGTISFLIERYTSIPAREILLLVAVVVGWVGGRWKRLLDAAMNAAVVLSGPARGRNVMLDLTIWEAAALALVWSLLCRASHTSKANTRRDIRWAFTFMGVVAHRGCARAVLGVRPRLAHDHPARRDHDGAAHYCIPLAPRCAGAVQEDLMTPDIACFQHNLVFIQGGAYDETWEWDIADVPVDFTGCSARMQVRAAADPSSPAVVDITSAGGKIVLGGTAGTIRVIVDASVTAGIAAGEYVYDINITWPGGTVQKFARGSVEVLSGVTQ